MTNSIETDVTAISVALAGGKWNNVFELCEKLDMHNERLADALVVMYKAKAIDWEDQHVRLILK